jgi:hypothetical protein
LDILHCEISDFTKFTHICSVLNAGFLQSDQVQRYIYKINWLNIKVLKTAASSKSINLYLHTFIYQKVNCLLCHHRLSFSGANFRKLAAHSVIFASSVLWHVRRTSESKNKDFYYYFWSIYLNTQVNEFNIHLV